VPAGSRQAELTVFCVVANIAEQTAHGDGGLELQRGVKHFPPGRDGLGPAAAVGRRGRSVDHRRASPGTHGRGFTRMVLARRHLTRFRVQGVYSPALIRALTRPLSELGRDHAPRLRQTRREAGQAATTWRDLPLAARADGWSVTTIVTDPPPAEITRQRRKCYLAHLNAHRVIYSRRPPPAEPPAGC
jgi:hypothetical protein